MSTLLTVHATVNASLAKVWDYWNSPKHVTEWNAASADWHTPRAESNLTPGGRFLYRMEAKDGSFGFDFSGIYDEVVKEKLLRFHLDDHRKVEVTFEEKEGQVFVTESFEAESQNSLELQQKGWQAILDNFKKYCEGGAK